MKNQSKQKKKNKYNQQRGSKLFQSNSEVCRLICEVAPPEESRCSVAESCGSVRPVQPALLISLLGRRKHWCSGLFLITRRWTSMSCSVRKPHRFVMFPLTVSVLLCPPSIFRIKGKSSTFEACLQWDYMIPHRRCVAVKPCITTTWNSD